MRRLRSGAWVRPRSGAKHAAKPFCPDVKVSCRDVVNDWGAEALVWHHFHSGQASQTLSSRVAHAFGHEMPSRGELLGKERCDMPSSRYTLQTQPERVSCKIAFSTENL
jgi:hypothetical protein